MRLAAILATVGAIMLFEFVRPYEQERSLAGTDAMNASGVVEQASRTKRAGKEASYEVSYRFDISGRTIHGRHKCQCGELAGFRVGEPIAIRYVRNEPNVNRPALVHYNLTWLLVLSIAGAVCLAAAPIVLLVQRRREDDSR